MGVWKYFLLTLLIELPIVFFIFKEDRKYVLLIAFLLNLFTWPVLHIFLFYTKIDINILEICVAMVESFGYCFLLKCNFKKALLAGFLANAISYGVGVILNNLY